MRPLDLSPGRLPLSSAAALLAVLMIGPGLDAQEVLDREGYLTPPEPIQRALLAPWQENVEPEELSPDGRFFVAEVRDRRMPPLSLLARKHYHLGGLQVDPAANRRRDLTTESPDGFRLVNVEDGSTVEVQTPGGAKVSTPRWSPDGSRLAFFVHTDDATHIWVADAESGEAHRVTPGPVLATLSDSFDWAGDGGAIFAVLVPEGRGPEPVAPAVPTTPRIDLTTDEENELRTFPDLLETPHDRALVEYYGTGQLVRLDVASGQSRTIGEPGLIDQVDVSPDGRWVRVRTVQRPFSKIVPIFDFARLDEIWDMEGNPVAVVDRYPVDDGSDDDEARREVAWRPDGQGLGFLEEEPRADEDGEEGGEEDDAREDRVMQWLPPFDSASLRVVYETEGELEDLRYSEDGAWVFVLDENEDEDLERLMAVAGDGSEAHTVASHDTETAYDDPGDLVTLPGRLDAPVARVTPGGGHVYLRGTLYHEDPLEEAPQPFLDRVEIRTGESSRVFQSDADRYEQVAAVLDDEAERLVIRRESPSDPPDWFLREGSEETRLTRNRDYDPALTGARREALWATRADGVRFKVEVTLPADYQDGERLPALFWHYPREYESRDDYHESTLDYNRNAFPRAYVRNMEMLARLGWAVVDPDVPIVGSRRSWNDLYVPHLRNSLSAAIDALDARGWIDRDRLAIGGHSYGGFGTLNSMIQTPYFKAGIAGSANSNRTLTPGGFQREERTLWEARETYTRMSPLLWMNELNGALLLYHGLDDQNVGTFPDHSIRSFHALNVLGKTAALYMYPYEEHGPDAEETILDLWARWTAWLGTYVENAGDSETDEAVTDQGGSGGGLR